MRNIFFLEKDAFSEYAFAVLGEMVKSFFNLYSLHCFHGSRIIWQKIDDDNDDDDDADDDDDDDDNALSIVAHHLPP